MNNAFQAGALDRAALLPWLIFPMLTVFLFSFGLVLFAQGMDSVFNVRLRARHAATTSTEQEGGSDGDRSVADPNPPLRDW